MTHTRFARFAIRYGADLYVIAYPSTSFVASPFEATLYTTEAEAEADRRGRIVAPNPSRLVVVALALSELGQPGQKSVPPTFPWPGDHVHHCHTFGCGAVLVCNQGLDACGVGARWECPTCDLRHRDRDYDNRLLNRKD